MSEGNPIVSVLVVDDDPFLRMMMQEELELSGFKVTTAADGADALAQPETLNQHAVLLIDIVLPGMSGPDVAAAIRAHAPDLKIIYVSGKADIMEAMELGEHYAVVNKPYRLADLVSIVRAASAPASS